MRKKIAICVDDPFIQSLVALVNLEVKEVKEVKQLTKVLEEDKLNRGYFPDLPSPAVSTKIGRNEPCICHSGKKYKNCCIYKP